jgi:hypothetical protein
VRAAAKPAIKFLLDQSWVFEQADHFVPDNLIEQFLANEARWVCPDSGRPKI